MTDMERIDAAIERVKDEILRYEYPEGSEPRIICKTILEALRFQKAALGEPSEVIWENLPRAIMMGRDMNCLTTGKMREHLQNGGHEIPEWLDKELSGDRHMAKGDVVVCIFKSMITELAKQVKGNEDGR